MSPLFPRLEGVDDGRGGGGVPEILKDETILLGHGLEQLGDVLLHHEGEQGMADGVAISGDHWLKFLVINGLKEDMRRGGKKC